ncbi:MAG: hypothetical protein ACRD0U_02290 [Acidimicrobiales bacterium]
MRSGLGRHLKRTTIVAAVGAWVLGVVGVALDPAGAQDDAAPALPPIFSASTSAFIIQVAVDTIPPALPIPELVKPTLPTVSGLLSRDQSSANASLFVPGRLTEVPSLLCQVGFPCEQIPRYPLVAEATYPLQPDSSAELEGPAVGDQGFGLHSGHATAHAAADAVTALAVAGEVGAAGLVRIGSAEAQERIEFVDGVLVATATSALSDVTIAGLLRIGSITSTSISRAGLGGEAGNTSDVSVQGVTLAGVPVSIGDGGLEISGSSLGGDLLGTLGQQLGQLLAPVGAHIRLLGTSDHVDAVRGATADARGLLVELEVDVSAIAPLNPLGFTKVTLGVVLAGADSAARVADVPASSPADVVAPTGPAESTGDRSTSRFVPGTPPIAGTPAAPAVAGNSPERLLRRIRLTDLLAGNGLRVLYVAWALTAAVVLSSRGVLAPRATRRPWAFR